MPELYITMKVRQTWWAHLSMKFMCRFARPLIKVFGPDRIFRLVEWIAKKGLRFETKA